ncbi:6721_t:CDS:1 [Paraglomus brasilianum]|uniref:6721_t:CDS:1 n=1 Tax=Paraglomus brasilianum TaxID=144538 RepID=A0A9N9BUT3_9GLOM|nr:6721_t:CDS:1 [Paraglomus brasilianum]
MNTSSSTPPVLFHKDVMTNPAALLPALLPFRLTLSIEELTNPSAVARNVARGHTKIPRPQNHFMLYKRDYIARLRAQGVNFKVTRITEITRQISQSWRKECGAVRQFFCILGNIAKEIHKEKYPKYVFRPKRMRNSSKEKSTEKEETTASEENTTASNSNDVTVEEGNVYLVNNTPSIPSSIGHESVLPFQAMQSLEPSDNYSLIDPYSDVYETHIYFNV